MVIIKCVVLSKTFTRVDFERSVGYLQLPLALLHACIAVVNKNRLIPIDRGRAIRVDRLAGREVLLPLPYLFMGGVQYRLKVDKGNCQLHSLSKLNVGLF